MSARDEERVRKEKEARDAETQDRLNREAAERIREIRERHEAEDREKKRREGK